MFILPDGFERVIIAFTQLFSKQVLKHAKVLLIAAILAPGKRTVSSLLRIVGLGQEQRFHKYHRLLSKANWSALAGSRILLGLLLEAFLPEGPVVVGIDETLERRWGKKIEQRGIYRDSVRSSKTHFVKSSGLRWICLMLLVPIKWAGRVWALPFLSVLAPSQKYATRQGKRHKKITDWALQMLLQLKRWLPNRAVIAVADSSYAVIDFLVALPKGVTMITCLRLDAALYEPAPAREAGKPGRNRLKGERLPTLAKMAEDKKNSWKTVIFHNWYGEKEKQMEISTGTALWYHSGKVPVAIRWVLIRDPEGKRGTRALLCTDQSLCAAKIVEYFVSRWGVEVTFEEMRAHLGMETQRQWSKPSIARSTPCLLGLFSIVTLLADQLVKRDCLEVKSSAWYKKKRPTFSDAIASVRAFLWQECNFCTSVSEQDMIKIPRQQFLIWNQALAWAA